MGPSTFHGSFHASQPASRNIIVAPPSPPRLPSRYPIRRREGRARGSESLKQAVESESFLTNSLHDNHVPVSYAFLDLGIFNLDYEGLDGGLCYAKTREVGDLFRPIFFAEADREGQGSGIRRLRMLGSPCGCLSGSVNPVVISVVEREGMNLTLHHMAGWMDSST